MDYKDRIRMFSCIYHIMVNGNFFVEDSHDLNLKFRLNCIKSDIIDFKGVHIGLRKVDGVFVPLTILIDRQSNPSKSIDGLFEVKINKLIIYENEIMQEEINF